MDTDKRTIKPAALEKLRQTIIGRFAEGLFHETTIRDICKEAGVSPQTVYKYFGNKEELLLACIEQNLAEISDRCEQAVREAETAREAFQGLCRSQFGYYAENPTIARIVYLNLPAAYWINQQSVAQARFQILFVELMRKMKLGSHNMNDNDIVLIQDICTGAASRVINRWLVSGQQEDLVAIGERFFELNWHLFTQGVGVDESLL